MERVSVNLRSYVVIALDEAAQRFPVALANRYLDTSETIQESVLIRSIIQMIPAAAIAILPRI